MTLFKTVRELLEPRAQRRQPVLDDWGRPLLDSEFPPQVWIENTNHCNAECVMCPRELQTRDKGLMALDLYTKIIDEVGLHRETVKRVHMHNYGEPLLDKKLPTRIRMAKERGIRHVYLVTNASLLTEKNARAIIEAGLDEFKISFYGTDRQSYNQTMVNLDFDKTLGNLRRFFEIRAALKATRPFVVLQFIPMQSNRGSFEEFQKMFEPLIDARIGDRLQAVPLHNYGDGRQYIQIRTRRYSNVCTSPWKTIVILQDGNVVPCCFDYNGTLVMGNVKQNSIAEIWNNDAYRRMRENFGKLQYDMYPVCTKCNVPYEKPRAADDE